MKFIIGRKIEMSQVYSADGQVTPVTILEAGPLTVTQIKTADKDGYRAVQVGFGKRKAKNTTKSIRGHVKELGPFAVLQEFRLKGAVETDQATDAKITRGQIFKADVFVTGDIVDVMGISIGRGFAGVVKRHGFAGSPATHGHKDQLRMPGSIGAQQPQHVLKGKRMGGHMGAAQVTVKNLEIIEVNGETNRLKVKGAVPGARGSIVTITLAKNPKKKAKQ